MRRVALRFAVVAVAGELAIYIGILPWPVGEASKAARMCFKAWLDQRGSTGASEDYRGVEAVQDFIQCNCMSRFDDWDDNPDRMIFHRAGTKKEEVGGGFVYYLTTAAWREAIKGFNSTSVARACVAAGILEPGTDGKYSKSMTIPSHGKDRHYVIRPGTFRQTEAAG